MTFSEFAKLLYPYCGGGRKTSDFVLSLVANIMENPLSEADKKKDSEDKYNPLAELDVSTLEKIFNGNRKLAQKNASTILAHLDKEKFGDYINALPLDTLSSLGKALCGVDVNASLVPGKCADMFADILEDCAHVKRSITEISSLAKQLSLEISEELVPDMGSLPSTISKADLYLLMEASSLCPSCGKTLVSDKGNNSLTKYRTVSILPQTPSDEVKKELGGLLSSNIDRTSQQNKLALCFDCANNFLALPSKDECIRLLDIKDKLSRNYNAIEALDKMYLEEQIEIVLRHIPVATQENLADTLCYTALRVRKKIPGSNVPLIIKTESFVVPYYKYIKTVFSQLEREGILNFHDIASDVNRSYRKLQSFGLSQDEIYAQLVNWIKNKTNAQSVPACEIIVAFFVQNCEVFDAIAK